MLNILNKLADEPGKNAKIDIMTEVKNSPMNGLFQKAMVAGLLSTTAYNIKKFDMPATYSGTRSLDTALDMLSELTERKVTGNAAQEWLTGLLSSLTADDAEVLARIIRKDFRAGFSESTVNKVWKGLIYDHPYQRGSGFSDKLLKKLKYPIFSQLKSDGLYSDTVVKVDDVTCFSRSGHIQSFPNPIRDAALMKEAEENGEMVVMGEVLVRNEDGTIMGRSESNGYMNRDDRDNSRVFVAAWDMVPLKDWGPKGACKVPYSERFARLERFCKANPGIGIELTEHRVCNNVQDVIDHFTEVRERGEEGTMLKNPKMGWKDGTSTEMIKVKVVMEVELKLVGWYYGTPGTKNETLVGGVNCMSGDDKIEVDVGTGISDKEREELLTTLDGLIANGQIVTVKCNGVTTSRSKPGLYSLFLPRLKEFRQDKFEADSLEKIQEQEASFTDALKLIGA